LKLCCLSVDLDEIPYYHEIYGLGPAEQPAANAVFDVALDRLSDFAKAYGVPLTFFVIGSTVKRPENAARLTRLVGLGHEIGNHSYGHNYRGTRLDRAVIARDIERAQLVIAEATGAKPVGFRAPGYTVTDELFDVLEEKQFLYDSSVFPCPVYYGAKAAAIATIAVLGKPSSSMIDTSKVLSAPTRPYRVGRPYWTKGAGLLELPVQVTRGLRLPYYGTTVCAAGPKVARVLTRMVVGEPLVNLELHGVDALGAGDGLDLLGKRQRDLRIPYAKKLEALGAAVDLLRREGYSFVRLDEAARRIEI
jgi:peptidoglycan-N-acetylglucosamine deacetylase